MSVSEYLRTLEAETPGITRRIWESQGSLCTKASDVACATALTAHIKILRGERVEITPSQWSDHRQSLGIVAYHRPPKRVELAGPDASPEAGKKDDEPLLQELTRLRGALDALTIVIESRFPVITQTTVNHQHSVADAFSMFDYAKDVKGESR